MEKLYAIGPRFIIINQLLVQCKIIKNVEKILNVSSLRTFLKQPHILYMFNSIKFSNLRHNSETIVTSTMLRQ